MHGRSNEVLLFARDHGGNDAQFVLVRNSHYGLSGHAMGSIGDHDWCILVGHWELLSLIKIARILASEFRYNGRHEISGGSMLADLRIDAKSHGYSVTTTFPFRKPVAFNQGRPGRWIKQFRDVDDVRDFLSSVGRLKISAGAVAGESQNTPWPAPPWVPDPSDYAKIAQSIAKKDPFGHLEPITEILLDMANGLCLLGDVT